MMFLITDPVARKFLNAFMKCSAQLYDKARWMTEYGRELKVVGDGESCHF